MKVMSNKKNYMFVVIFMNYRIIIFLHYPRTLSAPCSLELVEGPTRIYLALFNFFSFDAAVISLSVLTSFVSS